jgi:hypothetical protein
LTETATGSACGDRTAGASVRLDLAHDADQVGSSAVLAASAVLTEEADAVVVGQVLQARAIGKLVEEILDAAGDGEN